MERYLCPHCNVAMLMAESQNYEHKFLDFDLTGRCSPRIVLCKHIVCSNPKCGMSTLSIRVDAGYAKEIFSKRILPPFNCKPIPPCVPDQIGQDYKEACEICELSPKASATLLRRCLQGMIGDFWEVRKRTLADSIQEIKDKVEPDTWEAIESIRKIGNIGAHMEKDIDLIIDVDPEETKILIELVESLFEEWYVNREKRKERNAQIIAIRDQKEAQRKPLQLAQTSTP